MDPPKTTDPAARVIAILQSAIRASAQVSFLEFWGTAFEIDPKKIDEIYHKLSLFRNLLDDTERAIRRVPNIRHEQYVKPLTQLLPIIAQPNLQTGWHQHLGVLQMIMNGLEFASERLQAYSPEAEIPPSELEAIRKQVDELLQKLQENAGIPKSLKLILFDLLNAVRRSIDEYRFRGIRGVREELFVIASRIQEHLPEFEKAKDASEVKGFFHVLKKIDSVTAAALHVKELISAVAPLLPLVPALLEHSAK